jgi:hypothetical protein
VCLTDSLSVLLTKYNSIDQLEKNKMGGACSTYGGEKSVVRKLVRKIPLLRNMRKRVDDIKMDRQKVGCVGGRQGLV